MYDLVLHYRYNTAGIPVSTSSTLPVTLQRVSRATSRGAEPPLDGLASLAARVMSPQSQYKPLLPAPEAGGAGGNDPDKRVARRKRANRPNACENCRLKKARVS